MVSKLLWGFTATLVFSLMMLLAVDVHLYVTGGDTLSAILQRYFGASAESFRVATVGVIAGALLTHFTRWN